MGPSDVQVRLVEPRPAIFEAVLVTEDNKEAVKKWLSKDCGESYQLFHLGDWVVKKSSGSIEILEPDNFFAQYKSIL